MTYATGQLRPGAHTQAGGHHWNAAAAGWNQHAELIHDWLHDATQTMLDEAHIGPGGRVLDIAAGAGDQTMDIARRVGSQGRVLATDISPAILALAHKNAQAADLHQISTQVADAQSLGLAGSNFDAAVCRLGLMFCLSPLDALAEARKALKPGGRFSAMVFSQPLGNPCLTIALSTALKAAGLPQKPAFEPGTLLSLGKPGLLHDMLVETGFTDIHIQSVSAPFCVPTSQHYVDFVRSAGTPIMAILAPLHQKLQDAAWHDMAQQLKVFTTPTGWVGPNELLICAATVPL